MTVGRTDVWLSNVYGESSGCAAPRNDEIFIVHLHEEVSDGGVELPLQGLEGEADVVFLEEVQRL